MDEQLLELAKEDLKRLIIQENGEDFYYDLIAKKSKEIDEFRMAADLVFGKDEERLRKDFRESILDVYESIEEQMYHLCITDLALDVLIIKNNH